MCSEYCIQLFPPLLCSTNQIQHELTQIYRRKSLKVQKSQYQVQLKRKYIAVRRKEDGHPCERGVMDTEWSRGLKARIVSTRRWKTHSWSWEMNLFHTEAEKTLSGSAVVLKTSLEVRLNK